MAPRTSYGDRPMTSAERVKRARWVNRFEDTAFKLLDLLDEAPDPLPRKPEIPSQLLDRLKPFISQASEPNTKVVDIVKHDIRVLKLGNGNQANNKKKAMKFISKHFDAEVIDIKRTVKIPKWGTCHVAAYTHPKGAMISAPKHKNPNYGGRDWHSNDHIILFRDVGDGRCIIYINEIESLFNIRTIGQHGVTWENIEKLSSHIEVLKSRDVLDAIDNI